MPVMLCLAAFDAHSPLLYSHIVLIRFFAADASLHLCSTHALDKERHDQRNLNSNPCAESFSDEEGNLSFCGN